MTKPLPYKQNTKSLDLEAKLQGWYSEGATAYAAGKSRESNRFTRSEPMQFCAWNAGWVDAQRGLVQEIAA